MIHFKWKYSYVRHTSYLSQKCQLKKLGDWFQKILIFLMSHTKSLIFEIPVKFVLITRNVYWTESICKFRNLTETLNTKLKRAYTDEQIIDLLASAKSSVLTLRFTASTGTIVRLNLSSRRFWIMSKFVSQRGRRPSGMVSSQSSFNLTRSWRSIFIDAVIGATRPVWLKTSATFDAQCRLVSF